MHRHWLCRADLLGHVQRHLHRKLHRDRQFWHGYGDHRQRSVQRHVRRAVSRILHRGRQRIGILQRHLHGSVLGRLYGALVRRGPHPTVMRCGSRLQRELRQLGIIECHMYEAGRRRECDR